MSGEPDISRSVSAGPADRELLAEWDRRHVWHAFTQMAGYEPLIFERGEGCTLYDLEGRGYLDACSSLWCNLHGHRHPALDAAVREQLERVAHVTNLGASNPPAIRLARRLAEIAPPGLEHVFFSGDGACALEAAVKIAFQYWRQRRDAPPGGQRRNLFVALADAYHGDTLGSVSLGGVDRFNRVFGPLLFETLRVPMPDLYRLPAGVNRDSAAGHYLAEVERVLAAHADRIAAMVVEPLIQGAAGMVVHPEGYLRGVRELTRKYGVLLIADEVATGFGRTGTMFACEQEQVVPDLLCLGKGLTGGYLPMAATLATGEVWEAFLGDYAESRTFFHGHTYGGNPLSAAVALASLEVFQRERTLETLPDKTARLRHWLARLAEHPQVGDVRQRGLMAGVELVRDRGTREPFPWQQRVGMRVCEQAMQHGVYLRPLGNVVVVMPPLAISPEEIDRIGEALESALRAVFD